jgi:carnosine N-methyltransferase
MSAFIPDDPVHPSAAPHTSQEQQEEIQEQKHFQRVCTSFAQHAFFQHASVANQTARLSGLSPPQRALLPESLDPSSASHLARSGAHRAAADANQRFFDALLTHSQQPTSRDHAHYRASLGPKYVFESTSDMDKVKSVLKSLVRDWSAEGAAEREQCYSPVVAGLSAHLPRRGRVLVGGAGLGRLALELAARGFAVQGNDVSYHMLMASDFLLNCCGGESGTFGIAPFVGGTCNLARAEHAVRRVQVPDVDPAALLNSAATPPDFSMAAGEFLDCYQKDTERGAWDGVASCFFLDTAVYVGDYVRCIYDMLRPGGVLVNLGPLLWHWSGGGAGARPDDEQLGCSRGVEPRYLQSIDMTYEDLREIMVKVGFEIVEEKRGLSCSYTRDVESFMHTQYTCVYFVARKPQVKSEP